NEEKYLEKCLLALKPLLDAVSSELIIVDTGSTDKTVEIAGRFTDKVYRFDWADDFSAARNFGLEKCGGEWFMFLDADEIFDEDLSEMSGFFGDAETRKKYNSASYVVKNLIGAGDSYDFAPRRIGRRSGNLRFVGSVHENLTPLSPPRYDFKTFATHYGYLYDDEKRREQKKERNLSLLLRELENTPDSVRLLYQILPGMSGDERAEYLDRALKAARKINTNFSAPVFLTAIRDATSGGDHAKALSLAVEYTDRFKKKDVLLIDLCRLKADALISLERYGEALAVFDEYFEYCELNGEGKLDREPLNAICVEYSSEEKLSAAKARYCETLINAGDYPKAAEYIRDNFLSFEAERINDVIEALKNRLCDYADATLSYCLPEYFDGDAGALYWAVTAFSGALISANSIPPKDRALLYERFAHFTALYVANVYNPDLLNDSDVSSLPELVRFGYYASLARNGDASAYEAAASECASYAEAIGALSGKSV
ncbi:MAG: glycosyltransferase family 2 protein, partial [Oscillospiraceae bacterium]|nr:glycosyltransferase family 2 protein [Oscillospiraceae bacterium]